MLSDISADTKVVLGSVAALIAVAAYIPYFRDIFLGKTKPHAFSWLIWALLCGIGFAGQLADQGGAGSWITGLTSVACFAVFVLALFRGERDVTRGDWCCLFFSLAAIPLWILTESPLWSMILITIIDTVGFIPTFRKSYYKPEQETAVTYTLSSVKFLLAIVALNNYSIVTVLYPASLVLINGAFVVMVYVRRAMLCRSSANSS
ncbi:MAG: hypothetical protein J0M12_06810 [Deltaproteobacteria bacterium]|nr:hypothetical protein [Deltaproteobacteria bacterium]